MSPENRTYISSHQFNSARPGIGHVPAGGGMGQPSVSHMPPRPLNVQPRAIANPFHHGLVKQRIYDRLHPRNTYHAVVLPARPEQPDAEVKVDISHSRRK